MARGGRVGRLRRALARLATVRARATIAAVVVVGAALAVGGFGLVGLLGASIEEGLEASANTQLADIVSLAGAGQLPTRLAGSRGDTFTEVLDSSGRVVAASDSLADPAQLSRVHPGPDGAVVQRLASTSPAEGEVQRRDGDDGPYLVVSRTVASPTHGLIRAGPLTVYVAASLRPEGVTTGTVALALACGLPVLVIMVGGLVWVLSGRALRPVEAIRAQVADISGRDLHRRVSEPLAGDEVASLARTMNAMLDRLESSASHQRRFVADASHELRSPLTVLQATLEVALTHPKDCAWDAVAGDALEEARRLQRLVEDLLVLARADEGTQAPRSQVVDLDEMVLKEAGRLRPRSRVSLDLHRVSGGRVRGNPEQLSRVVQNLLDNAERHAETSVMVELSTSGHHVVLVVADDGPGIPAAYREQVFERFARLDEARSQNDGGTGLGLAIVKQIVEVHGGTIEVANSIAGAKLVIGLPCPDGGDMAGDLATDLAGGGLAGGDLTGEGAPSGG